MANDSYGMGIPLPADSTKIAEFPAVARRGFEKVAEVLAGGMTEGMEALAGDVVTREMANRDLVAGDDPRLPATVDAENFAAVTTDAAGRITEGTRTNGRKYLPQADITEAHVEHLTADNFLQAGQTVEQSDFNGYARITTDAEGRVAEDALDGAGAVPDWILARWLKRMLPDLSEATASTPELKIAAFGDSMTFGYKGGGPTYPATVGADLGMPVYNGGITAQTSTEIAFRQGGLRVLVSLSGDTIPATGAAAVSKINPAGTWRTDRAWTFPGTLAGIPGTLAKSAHTNAWTFTRSAAGPAVAVQPGTRFFSSAAAPYNNWISLFWVGRNNPEKDIILRDLAYMVSSLAPAKPRFLVSAVMNTTAEPAGSAGYAVVQEINTALEQRYGGNFFDGRRYLIDYGLNAAGITPTAADLTAISEDRLPPSLMSDDIHLTGTGYTILGHRIAALIIEKGWNK